MKQIKRQTKKSALLPQSSLEGDAGMKQLLVSAGLALASAALAVTCDLQTCLIMSCAVFWAGLARKEWKGLRDTRESENQARRRQLRRRLLGA